jgi:hypothetical protein
VSSVTDSAWAAGIRRERRSEALLVLAELAALAGFVLLRGDPATQLLSTWVAIAALTVILLRLQGSEPCGAGRPARWPGRLPGSIYAVRAHVDPGDRMQEEADAYAEQRAQTWWPWVLPFWLLQLVGGRWREPAVAVPAVLLLVVGLAGMVCWYRRLAAAGRRWLDDPPGRAPRPPYVPPPDQRPWTSPGAREPCSSRWWSG